MAYIITTSLYPSDKAPEVAKRYLEAMQKYPIDESLENPVVPAAVKGTQQGIKVLIILESKKGKLEEAYARSVSRNVMFQSIPGFESSTEVHYTLTEALTAIGMSLPE
jgi:hypothetical protein